MKDHAWAKRFVVEKLILEKVYRYFDEEGSLQCITDDDLDVELQYSPSQKKKKERFSLEDLPVTAAQTRGVKLSSNKVKKVVCL